MNFQILPLSRDHAACFEGLNKRESHSSNAKFKRAATAALR